MYTVQPFNVISLAGRRLTASSQNRRQSLFDKHPEDLRPMRHINILPRKRTTKYRNTHVLILCTFILYKDAKRFKSIVYEYICRVYYDCYGIVQYEGV